MLSRSLKKYTASSWVGRIKTKGRSCRVYAAAAVMASDERISPLSCFLGFLACMLLTSDFMLSRCAYLSRMSCILTECRILFMQTYEKKIFAALHCNPLLLLHLQQSMLHRKSGHLLHTFL